MPRFVPDEFAFVILGCVIYLFILLCTSSSHLLLPDVVEILCFSDFKKFQQEFYGKILHAHTLQTGAGMQYAGGEILLIRNMRFSLYFTNPLLAKLQTEKEKHVEFHSACTSRLCRKL